MLALSSCGKDNNPTDDTEAIDVYVTGYVANGDIYNARLWKNGIEQTLADAGTDATASAVYMGYQNLVIMSLSQCLRLYRTS